MYKEFKLPYPVNRPVVEAPKATKVWKLVNFTFEGGELDGQQKKLVVESYDDLPSTYSVTEVGQPEYGVYRLRPGTTTYVWVPNRRMS